MVGDYVGSYEAKISHVKAEISQILMSTYDTEQFSKYERMNKLLEEVLYAIDESTNIVITDSDSRILFVNDRFLALTKYKKNELIGKRYSMFNSGFHGHEFYIQKWETIRNGEIWRGEMLNKAKDGSSYWVNEVIIPFIKEDQISSMFIHFQTDITANKRMVNQFKTNFIKTFQNLHNGIFKVAYNQEHEVVYTMSAGKLMDAIGASADLVMNQSPLDVFEGDIGKTKYRMYKKALSGQKVQYELEVRGKLINVDLEPIRLNGEVIEVVGTVHDFSEFRDVEKRLKIQEERYQSLLNYSHEYIIMLDEKGIVLHMNASTMALFDVKEEHFGHLVILDILSKENRVSLTENFKKALKGEVQFFEFEMKASEKRLILNVTFVPLIIDGDVTRVYLIGKDITEEKVTQERNAYLAHHDELTGLPNRRWMETKIKQTLESDYSSRTALLSLDLDRFKQINDTLGHAVGDGLLQQIAQRLMALSHQKAIHVARMGGDEIMIVCEEFTNDEEVITIAQTILELLEKPFYVQDAELMITASIGMIFYTAKEMTMTDLMKRVDVALYRSKELGRNMYQVYEPSMNQENYQSFILERDLRKAIMNNEFVMHLQPKVNALTNEIVGAEALVRWEHPVKGLISPKEFIPLAEETGLIINIGKWIKRRACEQLVEWRNRQLPLLPISINISSQRLLQSGYVDEIQQLLQEFQLEGKWLEIEITENSIMRNEETVQRALKSLNEMGVKIFIDDFGTGYSSFNYLKTFKLDGIKIDQSFIRDISSKSENASITTAMIKMAQQLNLEVIAEGVETKEELDYLLKENCHYIQGYYFGKPCPVEVFERIFLKHIQKEKS